MVPATAAHPRIPRQRGADHEVVVVVSLDEDPTNAVLYGGRAAVERGLPLHLVLFHAAGRAVARCMAVMDGALDVARRAFPRLEVRVHLDVVNAKGWAEHLERPVELVVVGPRLAADLASPRMGRNRLAGCPVVVV
jgi:hypothetical protein